MAASGGRATKKASGSLNNVRPTPTSRAWVELSPIGDHRSIFCVAADYIPSVANGSDPTPMHNRIFDGCGRGSVHQLPVQRQTGVSACALIPTLVTLGSVVVDFALIDFFGVALVAVLSLLVYVGVGLLLTFRLPRHPIGWLLLAASKCASVCTVRPQFRRPAHL